LYEDAIGSLDLLPPTRGGPSRQDSVRLGLESLEPLAPETVLIHDAARPFVSSQIITSVLEGLTVAHGAIPAVPVRDSLKRGDAGGRITATVDRSALWQAQTPQGFRFPEIMTAHRLLAGNDLTDDAAICELADLNVILVSGDENNFKVTAMNDLARAEALLAKAAQTRTGMGFDVHRFGLGDHVLLCGVAIPHDAGLDGQSDADVALHALTDALLGAIGDGDIGSHFPPSDPTWRGVASDAFVAHAGRLITDRGGQISNVDVTIICERPTIGPHREAMRDQIAMVLRIPVDRVSVKATTTERLGFTGRQEGIAAQAIATVQIPLATS
jgi:2-C-methyl-D-erythritol 4-phosphate cytidylyltransferase/2-C-methyl-D-erythritol 2,4-cyclodiphosphate synthase